MNNHIEKKKKASPYSNKSDMQKRRTEMDKKEENNSGEKCNES